MYFVFLALLLSFTFRTIKVRAAVRRSFITTTVRDEYHKGATGRVRTGDQRLPVLCHCQLGQDIPVNTSMYRCGTPGNILMKQGNIFVDF